MILTIATFLILNQSSIMRLFSPNLESMNQLETEDKLTQTEILAQVNLDFFNGEIQEGRFEYICLDSTSKNLDYNVLNTIKTNLINQEVTDNNLPSILNIEGIEANVKWVETHPDYLIESTIDDEEVEVISGETVSYMGNILMSLPSETCQSLLNKKAVLKENNIILEEFQLINQHRDTFNSNVPLNSACKTLKQAQQNQGKTLNLVLVTDKPFENFVHGGPLWGDPITYAEVEEAFKSYIIDLKDNYPGFQKFGKSINIMWYNTKTEFPHCNGYIDKNNIYGNSCFYYDIYMEVIKGCSLEGQSNINLALFRALPEDLASSFQISKYPLGFAGLGSGNSVVFPGRLHLEITADLMKAYGKLNTIDLKNQRLADLRYIAEKTLIHEIGHSMHSLNHVFCDVNLFFDNPKNLCFTSQQKCESLTGDSCHNFGYNHPPAIWSVDTKGGNNLIYDPDPSISNYMGYSTQLPLSISQSSKDSYGKLHVKNIHETTFIKQGLMGSIDICGNSVVEEGEDGDSISDILLYNADNIDVINSCAEVSDSIKEVQKKHPFWPQKISLYKDGAIYDEDLKNYYETLTSIADFRFVERHIDTCRLNFDNCIAFEEPTIRLTPPFDKWPQIGARDTTIKQFFRFMDRTEDCSSIDWRFQKGMETFGPITSTISTQPGKKETCNTDFPLSESKKSPYISSKNSIFWQDDNNILYAYQFVGDHSGSRRRIVKTGILDKYGLPLIDEKIIQLPPEYGTVKKIEFVDFSPSYRISKDYNPLNMPIYAFNYFRQPVALIIVTEYKILIYHMSTSFLEGFETTLPRYDVTVAEISKLGDKLNNVVDISWDEGKKEIAIVYTKLSDIYDTMPSYLLRVPTDVYTPSISPVPFYPNIVEHYRNSASKVTTSPDKRAIVSLKQYEPADLEFIQQSFARPGLPLQRVLTNPERGPGIRMVHSAPSISVDNVGRYVFSTIQSSVSPLLVANHYTLTSDGLRLDRVDPLVGLRSSSYSIQPKSHSSSRIDKEGKIAFATPVPNDKAIFLADTYGNSIMVSSDIDPALSLEDSSQTYSMDIFEESFYHSDFYINKNLTTLTSTNTNTIVMTRTRVVDKPGVTLYLQGPKGSLLRQIDQSSDQSAIYSHFALHSTSAGLEPIRIASSDDFKYGFPQPIGPQIYQCTQSNVGLLGNFQGTILHIDSHPQNSLDVILTASQTQSGSHITILTTGEDKKYSTSDDRVLGIQTIPVNFADIVDGQLSLDNGLKAHILSITNNQYSLDTLDFISSPQKSSLSAPLGSKVTLSGSNAYAFSGTELYSCSLPICNFSPIFSFSSTASIMASDNGGIVFSDQSTTYLFDGKSMLAYPKKSISVTSQGKAGYEILYKSGQETIYEFLVHVGTEIISLQKIPIKTLISGEVIGALNVPGIVVLHQIQSKNIIVEPGAPSITSSCGQLTLNPQGEYKRMQIISQGINQPRYIAFSAKVNNAQVTKLYSLSKTEI